MWLYLALMFFLMASVLLRWALSAHYQKQLQKGRPLDETRYTVLQPILSGDPRLELDLKGNLEQSKDLQFLWLVDKHDTVAQETIQRILQDSLFTQRVSVLLFDEVPQEVNPKVYKLKQALPKVQTEFFLVLDDDTVIDFARFNEMSNYQDLSEDFIVTGIPYNYGQTGIWSKLLAAFINSNSILTYFSMAQVKANQTINGMFYISRKALFEKYRVFEAIQYELCDDLAVASFLLDREVRIIQSNIPCNVRNTVQSGKNYILLMKRWLLFASIYMKRFPSGAMFLLVLCPSLLPNVLVLLSLFLGWHVLLASLGLFCLKALLLRLYRQKTFGKHEDLQAIGYEVLSDTLLPFFYLYTILTPPVIQWRNKKIKVTDGKIRYV